MNTQSFCIGKQPIVSDTQVECRALRLADVAAIRALYEKLLHQTFTTFPAAALERYAADWTITLLHSRISAAQHVLLGAFTADDEAIGLLFGAPPESGVGTIIWLGLAADYRGRGIGAHLMRAAFAQYQERSCHKARIHTETAAARDFYCRLGMQVEGFHPRHWWQVNFWSLGMEL